MRHAWQVEEHLHLKVWRDPATRQRVILSGPSAENHDVLAIQEVCHIGHTLPALCHEISALKCLVQLLALSLTCMFGDVWAVTGIPYPSNERVG